MDQTRVAVHPWPAARQLIEAAGKARLIVISVATPVDTLRDAARAKIRTAVREVLGLQLARAPETITLFSTPGHALRLDLPGQEVGLSTSHELGISVAAIHHCGPVGVDIMRPPQALEWQPVARDYLGQYTFNRIASLALHEQLPAFAREWTSLEACLKCSGVGLQEWHPWLAKRTGAFRVAELELPAGLFGAVALTPAVGFPSMCHFCASNCQCSSFASPYIA